MPIGPWSDRSWPWKLAIRPGIVAYPLSLQNDVLITLLANMITLTPGTLSVEVSPDRQFLFIHFLDVADVEEEIRIIKDGFERYLLAHCPMITPFVSAIVLLVGITLSILLSAYRVPCVVPRFPTGLWPWIILRSIWWPLLSLFRFGLRVRYIST